MRRLLVYADFVQYYLKSDEEENFVHIMSHKKWPVYVNDFDRLRTTTELRNLNS